MPAFHCAWHFFIIIFYDLTPQTASEHTLMLGECSIKADHILPSATVLPVQLPILHPDLDPALVQTQMWWEYSSLRDRSSAAEAALGGAVVFFATDCCYAHHFGSVPFLFPSWEPAASTLATTGCLWNYVSLKEWGKEHSFQLTGFQLYFWFNLWWEKWDSPGDPSESWAAWNQSKPEVQVWVCSE